MIHKSDILHFIGNTPLVKLKRYSTDNVEIFAKLEGNNPGGSIKDRVALFMFNDAEQSGKLETEKIIIEATSGNTGISLAMIAAIKGYQFCAVMPESVSIERRLLLRAYGAQLILTDGAKGTDYAIKIVKEIVAKKPNKYMQLNQYSNICNIIAHYETTGREIINDMPHITHFIAGMGTGGTLMGVGKALKEFNKNIQIIGVEPMPASKIQGLRNMNNYIPPIFNKEKLDATLIIKDDTIAFDLARDLFQKEGISAGISSGAALWGAIEISKKIESGTIVTIFPDRGDKYISSLFNE